MTEAASPHEKSLLALAIRRPIGVTMILLACLLFGFVGYSQLPVTLLPDLSYPTVTVRTEFPGASPEDVEDRIGEPFSGGCIEMLNTDVVELFNAVAEGDLIWICA